MKMEPIVSSETSAIRTQTPGNYPKRNKLQLDTTYYFIVLLLVSTCFGQYYAHHQSCYSLQPGHYSSLTAPNFQPTATQERDDQCGNQHYSLELLMMGIVMPETY